MRMGRKFVVALAAALFVSAVPTTAFGEVIVYSPNKTSTSSTKSSSDSLSDAVSNVKDLIETGKMTMEEIKKLGPGYEAALEEVQKTVGENLGVTIQEALEEEENAGFNGPSVTKVELTQVYHEAYKTYELAMGNQFFLYSNVGNGGLTHEPVMIDIPANVTYTVEKDGLPYEYVSRQYISGKGTYVMKLMGIENKDAPLSEQKEYQATFRFRIQDEPPMEESEGAAENEASTGTGSLFETTTPSAGTDIPVIEPPKTDVAEETTTPAETEDPAETEALPAPGTMGLVPREQKFELATGNYIVTLENGKQLTTSVPEGYVGSGSVYLSVPEGDAVTTTLYKNDQPVDFVNNSAVTEYGRYRVDMEGQSYFFTLAYEVGQMEYYPAPTGMEFTEVLLNDEVLTLASNQYLEMIEDGTYAIAMNGENGDRFEVTLVKDTVAPEMVVTTNKSTAAIQYLSDDISSVELMKDGKAVAGFSGTSITEPGKYTLTIYDNAGNSSATSFALQYQVNMYGILAVALVILTIAGIVVFVVHIKKNTKVR